MLARQLIATDVRSIAGGTLRAALFNTTARLSSIDDDEKPERAERKLKEWRKPPPVELTMLSMFQRPPKKGEQLKMMPKPVTLAPREIRSWVKDKIKNYDKFDQRFIRERHETLGCDLAAAHFLVFRGGKVKCLGQDDWIGREELTKLPTKYDPYWQLTHVDTTECKLLYEGLENFINLGKVKWASFKGNERFDDWYLDKVAAQMPNLEYLDVSECKLLTERGLGSLYRLYNLKTLIITNWEKLPSFELTCVMLQDLNSELVIDIKDPEKGKKKK